MVVAVDDHLPFMECLRLFLGSDAPVKIFDNPRVALDWLHEMNNEAKNRGLPISVGYDEQTLIAERRMVALDVDQIYKKVMYPDRFNFPAVVIVDYSMPQMNGVDFCRELARLPCKKILLTGVADESVATAAFNKGLIDRYLKKCDPDILERLKNEIAELTAEYFQDKSRTLNELLEQQTFAFLSDDTFTNLVNALAAQYGFVERFIFADPAGILFFDAHGKPTLMVVETESGMASHLEAAQYDDAPAELLTALQEKRVVPFFWESGGMYTNSSQEWEQYCLPAQLCEGRQNYYWALFDLPRKYLPNPIYSYRQFLEDLG